jgi:hypothetical protein
VGFEGHRQLLEGSHPSSTKSAEIRLN